MKKSKNDLPSKPYKDFPLTPHASGMWQKKIRGKVHYFGRWGRRLQGKLTRLPDPEYWQPALTIYQSQANDLHAGRTPRVTGDALRLKDLYNRFLTAKKRKLEAGEITARTFGEYKATTDLLIVQFGRERFVDDLASDDFEALRSTMADRWGPVRLGNAVQRVKTVYKWGYEAGLYDRPIRYGPDFTKPSASVLRRHKAKNGERYLEADQLRRLLAAADVQLQAMILLGVNCGYGNHDVATLPLSALDLEKGMANFPRPKTGIARRCPLWPETVQALKAAIAERPEPGTEAAEGLMFITGRGGPWITGGIAQPVVIAMRNLMQSVGVYRKGIGFYMLRHVHRTVSDGARDPVASNLIMGHADASMGATYTERIDDDRLVAVTDHVRKWLFPAESPVEKGGEA
ncbi:hypothetical protein LCGC14_1298320 [marine sediment metagenome]|uniref:Tyr recombinase domain-containing protein n=1 Tax=marine sediment metagenome TaxID=412755 RepID=A0A0F9KRY4_9ZZZZ